MSADNPYKTYLNYRNNLLMLYKNMPLGRRLWVMPLRLVLDWLSVLVYLLQGKPKMAAAAVKGRWHHYRMRRSCQPSREENREHTIVPRIKTQWKGMLLLHYYLFFQKKFSKLGFNPRLDRP